jgi:hypothetical protein
MAAGSRIRRLRNLRAAGLTSLPLPIAVTFHEGNALAVPDKLAHSPLFLIDQNERVPRRDPAPNGIFAFDTRLKLSPNWVFTGQVMNSETHKLDGTQLSGAGYLTQLNYSGRNFTYSAARRSPAGVTVCVPLTADPPKVTPSLRRRQDTGQLECHRCRRQKSAGRLLEW